MVRNFYLDAIIDGRATRLTGGSARKDGGMRINITQREHNTIADCLNITCCVEDDELVTVVFDKDGNKVFEHRTER